MKVKSVFLFLLISILLLSACTAGRSLLGSRIEMLNKDNDDKVADASFTKILKFIKNRDRKSLKAMFSKQALKEAQNIDEHIDYVLDFFQGEVQSWNRDAGPLVEGRYKYGEVTKEFISFYSVTTDQQKYLVFVLEYPVDTIHPDNVGLYALRIIKAEDKATQYGYWQDMNIAGIYKPN